MRPPTARRSGVPCGDFGALDCAVSGRDLRLSGRRRPVVGLGRPRWAIAVAASSRYAAESPLPTGCSPWEADGSSTYLDEAATQAAGPTDPAAPTDQSQDPADRGSLHLSATTCRQFAAPGVMLSVAVAARGELPASGQVEAVGPAPYPRVVPKVHQLSRTDARRIAVRAQLLDKERPTDLLDVVHHLTLLQVDPISAVAPSADLVLWSRLGSAYSPEELQDAVDEQRLIDHHGYIRPAEDLALFRAAMAEWPGRGELKDWQEARRDWLEDNNACRRDILELLRGRRAVAGERAARHLRPAVGVDRLEQEQERHDAARPPRPTRRGRVRRAAGAPSAVGPGRSDLPRRPRRTRRGGAGHPQRAPATQPRHRPGRASPSRPASRTTSATPASRPSSTGCRGSGAWTRRWLGPAVLGPRRAAVAVRPPRPRPQADGRAVRLRLPARDVQARRQAALGLLRAARSCTATGWSESSTPPPTARPGCSGSTPSTKTRRSARPRRPRSIAR